MPATRAGAPISPRCPKLHTAAGLDPRREPAAVPAAAHFLRALPFPAADLLGGEANTPYTAQVLRHRAHQVKTGS